jgi:hypothetical protein
MADRAWAAWAAAAAAVAALLFRFAQYKTVRVIFYASSITQPR